LKASHQEQARISTAEHHTGVLIVGRAHVEDPVAAALLAYHFHVRQVAGVRQALDVLRREPLDLVLVHDDVPPDDVLSILKLLPTGTVSVLLGGSTCDVTEQVVALELGYDDVWPLEMHPRLVAARVRALVRRKRAAAPPGPAAGAPVVLGTLALDPLVRRLQYRGTEIPLTEQETRALSLLLERRGTQVDREELHRAISSAPSRTNARLVDSVVCRLRRKLEDLRVYGARLESIRGKGYRLSLADAAGRL
jgi:DNA-binding response OmpR family regulator